MAKKKKITKKSAKKPAARSTGKKYIAKAPIRRLMKNEGAQLVAEAAVVLLIDTLTTIATDLTKAAIRDVKTDKRKRLMASDIIMASRSM